MACKVDLYICENSPNGWSVLYWYWKLVMKWWQLVVHYSYRIAKLFNTILLTDKLREKVSQTSSISECSSTQQLTNGCHCLGSLPYMYIKSLFTATATLLKATSDQPNRKNSPWRVVGSLKFHSISNKQGVMRQSHAEDTRDSIMFNKLQMQLEREHLLHSYLKISYC